MSERQWQFGCPKCHHAVARVVYAGHDEDGYPMRLYQCKSCQRRWGTEERVVSEAAFFARAYSGNERARWRWRRTVQQCKVCPGQYQGGSYAIHKESVEHKAHRKSPDTSEKRRRQYYREAAA